MKRVLKQLVQGVVARVAPTLWKFRGTSLLVIMYHRVLPEHHPDRANEQPGMYVSPQTLTMHLSVLKQHFTLMHLDDWIAASEAGRKLPTRSCAITFDDGWRDNYQYAYPILKQSEVPATIYLVSDLVGTRYSFWPNTLARVLASNDATHIERLPQWLREMMPVNRAALSAAGIDAIISRCKQRSDAEMLAALQGGCDEAAGERDLMNWAEIREMQASGLVRFGSHTRRHTRVSLVRTADALRDEVIGSRDAIGRQLAGMPVTFCYPNGDTSEPAVKLVRETYRGAVTTAHGWNDLATDRSLLHRIGVHEDVSNIPSAFLSRLAGVG